MNCNSFYSVLVTQVSLLRELKYRNCFSCETILSQFLLPSLLLEIVNGYTSENVSSQHYIKASIHYVEKILDAKIIKHCTKLDGYPAPCAKKRFNETV